MKCSIIIPAYNAGAFIARSIASALTAGRALEPEEWELILVDNNSVDDTAAIMEQRRAANPFRIRRISASQQGPPAARNAGLELARGEWIQFLDADDTLLPGKIPGQLAGVTPDTGWVISGYREVFPDGVTADTLPAEDPWKGLVYLYRIGQTSANLYRRSALNSVGNWNEHFPDIDDPELHYRLLRAGVPFLIDPVVRSHYIHHGGQRMTTGERSGPTAQFAELVVAVIKELSTNHPEYWEKNADYFQGALLRKIRHVATHDLKVAGRLYQDYFLRPQHWARTSRLQLVPRYTRLYPYLGFRNLERLRLALAGVLPVSLKQRLKS